ncbi:MAG: DUF6607 family protein [Arenimonas sp.]
MKSYPLLGAIVLIPLVISLFPAASQAVEADHVDADRQAILSMLGEYEVDFHFQETLALKAGYALKPSKDSGAFETVILVENSPKKIVLQHILVGSKGEVTKHWRQDWSYEAKERFEFSAEQTFSRVKLSPEKTAGAWTQCVFEVSDAPRYCGTGKWDYSSGNPTWTSDQTWRPLPRREYTTRTDYNVMAAVNRHTITPAGWAHEQDNGKIVRSADGLSTLVREFGFNDYQKTTAHDFTPAYAYWEKTKAYWARIRAQWQQQLASGDRVVLKTKVDGMPIILATFSQAESIEAGKEIKDGDIKAIFDKYTSVASDRKETASP